MVKVVEGVLCTGCAFSSMALFGNDKRHNLHFCKFGGECPVGAGDRYNLKNPDLVIKDLGIFRNGLLPCPFCGEYPTIIDHDRGSLFEIICCGDNHDVRSDGESIQEAIDAWNARL